ncbi:hypothetical protein [Lyngbya confervoides]|uniref:Uncharacterized protein n=1 Tax=Lyngbya confervoides BDU141951 TaxID=1574623 RepID=A0ABD4T097_9CYAN|nr:hypothetical protein [Lyngbya confervoides]MCM1982040.1 hypothetical protein [Lyngbya confervoides BDU141951]
MTHELADLPAQDCCSSDNPGSVRQPDLQLLSLTADTDIGDLRMVEAYDRFVLDEQSAIPFTIRLLENPKSPIAFPGSVDLKGHDYLHLLLNRGITLWDEAFVVGFTMGNCDRLRPHHIYWYKVLSTALFPQKFRFNRSHFKAYDLGVMYGQKVPQKNLHRVNFEQYAHLCIGEVRRMFSIDLQEIQMLWNAERLLVN